MALRGGIDLGGTKIAAIVVDDAQKILGQAKRTTPKEGGPPDVARELVAAMREAATAAGIELSALAGIGVGAPGEVDAAAGTLARAGNLPGWDGVYPLAAELSGELGVARIELGNDVGVAVDAERRLGAGRTHRSFIGAWWGTGLGGALVLDGELWHGRGAAGELGHTIVKLGGRRCPDGSRGCLEAYTGRASLEKRARKLEKSGRKTKLFEIMREHGRTRLTSGVWGTALDAGDKLAHELIGEAVEALGVGLASAVNLLDLDAVVIGGGLGTRLGEPYVEKIAAAAKQHLFVPERPPAFLLTELGDDGGAIGAALLVSA